MIQPDLIDDLIARGQFVPKPPPVKRRGHAAPPGDRPKGETCGSCRHYTRWQSTPGRIRRKCAHRQATWTKGAATDIRKKDPACALWKPPASLFGHSDSKGNTP